MSILSFTGKVILLPVAALGGLALAGYAFFKGGEAVVDHVKVMPPETAASAGQAGAKTLKEIAKKSGSYLGGFGQEIIGQDNVDAASAAAGRAKEEVKKVIKDSREGRSGNAPFIESSQPVTPLPQVTPSNAAPASPKEICETYTRNAKYFKGQKIEGIWLSRAKTHNNGADFCEEKGHPVERIPIPSP